MKRILLLHGYTEAGSIFDPLRPLLPPAAEVVVPELEQEFAQWPCGPRLTVATMARHLAARYHIGPHDVLIGHSMGGWLAAHIKEQTGATAILLGGFTDQAKIVSSIRHPLLLKLYALSGLVQSNFMSQRFKRNYRRDESRELYAQLVDRMPHFRRRYVQQQLQLLFAPVPPLTTEPDLRLHARRDNIIRPPDEPFTELPGDHFTHYFYPQLVVDAIRPYL